MNRFCSHCGKEVEESVRFCAECGTEQLSVTEKKGEPELPKSHVISVEAPMGEEHSFLQLSEGIQLIFHGNQGNRIAILKELFLSFDGRLNRGAMILRSLFLGSVLGLLEVGLGSIAASTPSIIAAMFGVIVFGLLVVQIVASLSLIVRRLHDLETNGWWILLTFIPYVNLFLSIYICFIRGTKGANRYGADPLP